MALLETKSIDGGIVDVDVSSRRVVTNWSGLGNVDYDKDLITDKAYNKTIQERGPKGKNLIYWITDHNPSVKNIVGGLQDLYVKGNHLQAVGVVSNTTHGNDVLQLYKDGIIRQHSVGFVPTRTEDAKSHRIIHEVMLYEGSSVLWGANIDTGTETVGKSLMTIQECNDEMDILLKAWRNGTYTDETFGLLEVRIKQIQKYYSDLISAPSDKDTRKHAPSDEDTHDIDELKSIITDAFKF